LTIEANATSQYEQQVRAVCGLPLGSTELRNPAAMANLLGDLWQGGEPLWSRALAVANVSLHLYCKGVAKSKRKMGHLTVTGESGGEAFKAALRARDFLNPIDSSEQQSVSGKLEISGTD
jgi:5-(carboxyamino)imidazole ribonucleotide synthase